MPATSLRSDIESLPLVHQGKVRDIYAVDDQHMLIVATDRLSAFDVVLPNPIPGKGAALTALSNFWFNRTRPPGRKTRKISPKARCLSGARFSMSHPSPTASRAVK